MVHADRPDDLTAREREVLDLVRLGLTNEEIASRLGITEAGAKYHVSQILSKLGVATREEAAAEAGKPRLREAGWRRRWWAALPLAAKAAGAAVVLATVAGLGLLAWGVIQTGGPTEGMERGPPSTASTRVVAWSEVPAPGVAEPFTVPGIPPCQAADLVMSVSGDPYVGIGPKDTSFWIIGVTNNGTAPCFVGSTFDVGFTAADGKLTMQAERTVGDIVYLEGQPGGSTPSPRFSLKARGEIDTRPCAIPPVAQMQISPGPGLGTVLGNPGPAGGWGAPCPNTAASYLAQLSGEGLGGGYAPSTQTAIDAPAVARPGERLRFLITITDQPVVHSTQFPTDSTPAALVFSPCPTYHEELEGEPGTFHTYQLNCEQATTIEPYGSETFEMFIDVPVDAHPGPAVLIWSVDGSPATYQTARTNIWIEP